MSYPLKGSCQCGCVTYVLHEAPIMVLACHCKECQKLSTSAFSITALVNAGSIEFHGEMAEWSRVADSGRVNAAKFCPVCGTRIYHFCPEEPHIIKLKPSTLEDATLINPSAHVWVCQKQSWYQIPEGVQVYEKQP